MLDAAPESFDKDLVQSPTAAIHVFTVMLAYMIVRYLRYAWRELVLTPEEGIRQLSTLSSVKISVKGKECCLQIPQPREQSRKLLAALNMVMPTVLPDRRLNVDTKKKRKDRKFINWII